MRLLISGSLGLVVLAIVGIAARSDGSTLYAVPPGLTPGETYRLVFITDGVYTSTDYSIADYNSEVNAEANAVGSLAALNTTWTVIGSTPTVNAIDNIGQDPGVPIYNTAGLLVANDATTNSGGLFSGSIFTPIEYDENGNLHAVFVFTGTNANGVVSYAPLGPGFGCCSYGALLGIPSHTDSQWVQYTVGSSGCTSCSNSLYAISGILTVPTPEPSTGAMAFLGGVILLFAMRREQLSRPSVRGLALECRRLVFEKHNIRRPLAPGAARRAVIQIKTMRNPV